MTRILQRYGAPPPRGVRVTKERRSGGKRDEKEPRKMLLSSEKRTLRGRFVHQRGVRERDVGYVRLPCRHASRRGCRLFARRGTGDRRSIHPPPTVNPPLLDTAVSFSPPTSENRVRHAHTSVRAPPITFHSSGHNETKRSETKRSEAKRSEAKRNDVEWNGMG